MKDIWEERHSIRFGDIDRSDRLTLGATFDYFQEAAISHAENLGVGRESMAKTGQVWILSRISVYLARRPKYGETVMVRSWPRSWEKLFAIRDYDIRDEAGEAAVRGRSGWLILDMEKRRPLRVQQIVEALPPNGGVNAFSALAPGLEERDNLGGAGERKALYSDIDYNGHLNNTRYIQWIQDITDPEILESAGGMRLDINYLSEVKPGESVELRAGPILPAAGVSGEVSGAGVSGPAAGAADYPGEIRAALAYEGRRPGSGQPVFRAELRTGV
ncbi:MAG: acyl-ACP thioesterase [Treponema sp.]|jgi:acyl-ACP thioesterase|nr:acyl-ACP thioesterase [Treponema sp.]